MATPTQTNRNASGTKPQNPWVQKELGVMWRRKKQATNENYLTGTLNLKNLAGFPDQDVPIVVFTNKAKNKDTHPDLRVYLSERKPQGQQGNGNNVPQQAAPAAAPAAQPIDSANDLI